MFSLETDTGNEGLTFLTFLLGMLYILILRCNNSKRGRNVLYVVKKNIHIFSGSGGSFGFGWGYLVSPNPANEVFTNTTQTPT